MRHAKGQSSLGPRSTHRYRLSLSQLEGLPDPVGLLASAESTFRSVRRTANRVENVQQARSVVIRARAHVRTSTPRLSAADGRGHYVGLPPAPNGDHSKRTPKPCATLKTSRTEPAPSPYLQGDSRHRNLQWMAMGTNLCRARLRLCCTQAFDSVLNTMPFSGYPHARKALGELFRVPEARRAPRAHRHQFTRPMRTGSEHRTVEIRGRSDQRYGDALPGVRGGVDSCRVRPHSAGRDRRQSAFDEHRSA
jgi:hypothetical protein